MDVPEENCRGNKFPFNDAVRDGNLEVVQYLMEQGENNDAADCNGRNALHFAATEGHLKVMQYLIEQGVSAMAMATDNYVKTPLHGAAHRGHLEVVRCLFERGVEIDAADRRSWSH